MAGESEGTNVKSRRTETILLILASAAVTALYGVTSMLVYWAGQTGA